MLRYPAFYLLAFALLTKRRALGFLPSFSCRATNEIRDIGTTRLSARKEESKAKVNRMGFLRVSRDNKELHRKARKAKKPDIKYNITTLQDLDSYFDDEERRFRNEKGEIDYDALLKALSVKGDTQRIGSPDHPEYTHPVAKLLHERKRTNSPYTTQHKRSDGCRVALAIEGGGMRGCVSAGMVCAIHYLNLTSTIDVVYGSSAGTIVGAYLITGQLPWFGPEVYYDQLTTAGRKFIDTRRLLRALGFGLLDPRLFRDVITRPHHGKPVLNLPFLLKTTVQETKPLNWDAFVEKQKIQPLKVIASGLKSERPVVMDYDNKSFETLEELTDCMHASCLLPGIAGPLMNLNKEAKNGEKKLIVANNLKDDRYEPLADALLYEPLPYRSALEEGATHVIVIRSRPDGVDVTGKGGFLERLIFRRFFLRKNRLPNMFRRLAKQLHKKLYAEDIIRLNEDASSERYHKDTSEPHLMTIAAAPGSAEVTRLETGRESIFEGLRRGFARAYDCLVEDPAERGRGAIVAKECFPDEILDYDPLEIKETQESAFEVYMRMKGTAPKSRPLEPEKRQSLR